MSSRLASEFEIINSTEKIATVIEPIIDPFKMRFYFLVATFDNFYNTGSELTVYGFQGKTFNWRSRTIEFEGIFNAFQDFEETGKSKA